MFGNNKIRELEETVYELSRNQKSNRLPSTESCAFAFGPPIKFTETLTADMILDRFEELYEYLGIERKELPKQDRTHKLVKKTKGK